MAKLIRTGVLAPALLMMVCGLFAVALGAQDDSSPDSFSPDKDKPITIDFVQKDLHTVMHYIALRSGLAIIVEGEVAVKLTVMFREVDPKAAIQSICKANKLDYIEDGVVIIIKARPQVTSLANVVRSEFQEEGKPLRYNVNFESHELVAAIMEVANVTKTQVFVPAVQQPLSEAPQRGEDEAEQVDRVLDIQSRKISIHMRDALPANILDMLAKLGDLEMDPETLAGSVPGSDLGYRFKYKRVVGGTGPIGDITDLKTKAWEVPSVDINKLKSELGGLLSTAGVIVADETTRLVQVWDIEDHMKRVEAYMTELTRLAEVYERDTTVTPDPMTVYEFRMIRDASQASLLTSIQGALTDEGRVVSNPDRNSLIVYDRASRIKDLQEIMKGIDMAPEQVLITAKLIEVGLDEYMGYGLELFTSHSADNLNRGRFTGSSQDSNSGTAGGMFGQPTGFDPFFATFTNPRIDVRLELLANEGRVKTLSQPTQMVSNRKQARIEVGQEIPYLAQSSATGGATTVSVSFKEVSIVMDVTPTVLENGLIRIEAIVTVREVIGNVAIEGNNTPVLSKRESKTDVFIRDGETLVMGGLIRERERTDENGLPFLKDIPFLGYLFKSANKTVNKTDLLFFLRPQIVNANGPQITSVGQEIERDLRPLIYEDEDAEKALIRPGRFRKLDIAPKPAWYNDQARPKSSKDVKPGA